MVFDSASLHQNPYAKVGLFPNRQSPSRIVVCAPSRGRGLLKNVIDQRDPERWAVLQAHLAGANDEHRSNLLHELGLVLEEDEIPRDRPVFACWLDEVQVAAPCSQLRVNRDIVCEWAASSRVAPSSLESTFEWGAPSDWLVKQLDE